MHRRPTNGRTLFPALVILAACAGPGAGKTAYVGASVFDGTGAPVLRDGVILVAGGHVEAVGSAVDVPVPRGAEVVDLSGTWVIPGLIDAYVRPERWALGPMLSYGVTSARAVGGIQDSALFLRTDVETGVVAGPRLYITGAVIDAPGSGVPEAQAVRTVGDARRAVDNRVLIDAAYAAVGPKLSRTLLRALHDEAQTLQTPISAELGVLDALTATREGVAAIDRLTGIVEATAGTGGSVQAAHAQYAAGRLAAARAWAGLDSTRLQRTAGALREAGVTIIPVLVGYEVAGRLTDQAFVSGLDLSGVPDTRREEWDAPTAMRARGLGPGEARAFRRARPMQDLFVRLFRRAGGRVATGTGAPEVLLAPGAALHDELALLVAAGLSTEQALLAATRDGARLLRADSLGVLVPGAVADLVVLEADPFVDILNTRRIRMIVTHGVPFRPDELRQAP